MLKLILFNYLKMVYDNENEISHEKRVSSAPLHLKFPNPTRFNAENYLECESLGIRIKHKIKFTRQEDERIKKNWRKFKRKFNVSQVNKILGIFTSVKTDDQDVDCVKRERKEVRLFKYQTDFYLRLAYKLDDRTIYSIYQRARKILPDLLTARELSRKQKKRIIQIAKENGLNKWSEIAKQFNCHSKSVNEIVRNKIDLKEGRKFHKGKYTDEEDQKLIDVLKQVLNTDDLSYHYSNIPWTEVSHRMRRAAADCKQRWQHHLHWKISNPDNDQIRLREIDKIKFIYCLYRLNHQSEDEIDWDFLKEKFSR